MIKLKIYFAIAGAFLLALLKVWFMGYSKAKDEAENKAKEIKIKAYENLNEIKEINNKELDNVKAKISNNDFSSFNDN